MSNLIQVPVEVTNFQPRKDRSWKLTFETQRELSGEEVTLLADSYLGTGHLLFSANPDELSADKIPDTPAENTAKTPSSRLRDVLYIMWVQREKPGGAFNPWYEIQIEKFIDTIKSKLEPNGS